MKLLNFKFNIQFYWVRLLLLSLIVNSCANPVPPSGGPKDETPPQIIDFHPANRTINFDGSEIVVEFDKWMNKSKVIENIFITPDAELDYDWSGTELTISFINKKADSTTYVLTIGTDYEDWLGNKPTQSFSLIFATGSKLDSGKAFGNVIDDKPEGTFIFAYNLNSHSGDTLDIRMTKPDYRTMVGTNGAFSFGALKPAKYRLFSIKDKFKDGIYDEGIDEFFAPNCDIEVREDSAARIDLRVGNLIDNSKPGLISGFAEFANLISANFSENIASEFIDKKYFELSDSATNEKLEIYSAYFKDRMSQLFLNTDVAPEKSILRLSVNASVLDTSGNPIDDTLSTVFIQTVNDKDSSLIEFNLIGIKDSSENIPTQFSAILAFTSAIRLEDIQKRVKIKDQLKDYQIRIIKKGDSKFELSPSEPLESAKPYQLEIDLVGTTGINGNAVKDSILRINFISADDRIRGNIAGAIRGVDNSMDKVYVLKAIALKDKKEYNTKVIPETSKFVFKNIPPDKYNFFLFEDANSNMKFDIGSAYPFGFSEKFYFIDKGIELKPRWSIDDAILEAK